MPMSTILLDKRERQYLKGKRRRKLIYITIYDAEGKVEEEARRRRARVQPPALLSQMWQLQPMHPCACACLPWQPRDDHRVLPGGVAVQMRQQALHALIT